MVSFKILDGALGSELIMRGLTLPKHIWSADANITSPKIVQKIHQEYVDAGTDYITANTFRSTPRAFENAGSKMPEAAAKFSLYKAVDLAKKSAGNSIKVAGSIGPLEDCYSPDLFPGKDTAITEFRQLGGWLSVAGVDILLLETMNSLVETEAGLIALESFELPLWVSFVLKDDYHLLSGDRLADVINILRIQRERMGIGIIPSIREYREFFGITNERIKRHKKEIIIMHPGPINRGVEIDSEVVDSKQAIILDQVLNGVAVRMSVLYLLLGSSDLEK